MRGIVLGRAIRNATMMVSTTLRTTAVARISLRTMTMVSITPTLSSTTVSTTLTPTSTMASITRGRSTRGALTTESTTLTRTSTMASITPGRNMGSALTTENTILTRTSTMASITPERSTREVAKDVWGCNRALGQFYFFEATFHWAMYYIRSSFNFI